MSGPDLAEWNQRTVELMQASLGEIRPEIRRISLSHRDALWVVTVVVDEMDDQLHTDITEDIITEFAALVGQPSVDGVIEVLTGALPVPGDPVRVTYLRHEPDAY